MTVLIGDLIKDVVEKVVQNNTFECKSCKAKFGYYNRNEYPDFPCPICKETNWQVYSINDHVIYKK